MRLLEVHVTMQALIGKTAYTKQTGIIPIAKNFHEGALLIPAAHRRWSWSEQRIVIAHLPYADAVCRCSRLSRKQGIQPIAWHALECQRARRVIVCGPAIRY
jgi:hypothetical protein